MGMNDDALMESAAMEAFAHIGSSGEGWSPSKTAREWAELGEGPKLKWIGLARKLAPILCVSEERDWPR